MGGRSSLIVHTPCILGVFHLSSATGSAFSFLCCIRLHLPVYFHPCLVVGKGDEAAFNPLASQGSRSVLCLPWLSSGKLLHDYCFLLPFLSKHLLACSVGCIILVADLDKWEALELFSQTWSYWASLLLIRLSFMSFP